MGARSSKRYITWGIGHQLRDLTQTRQKDQDSALTRVLEVGVCVIRPCEFYGCGPWFFEGGEKNDPKKVVRIFCFGEILSAKKWWPEPSKYWKKRKKSWEYQITIMWFLFFALQTATNGKDNGKREPFQRERSIFQSLFFRGHVGFLGEYHFRIQERLLHLKHGGCPVRFFG